MTTGTINSGDTGDVVAESIQVMIESNHTFIGDLTVELTSPQGTVSVLMFSSSDSSNADLGFNGDTDDYLEHIFITNAFYEETVFGTWTVKVKDERSTETGNLKKWELRFFGRQTP